MIDEKEINYLRQEQGLQGQQWQHQEDTSSPIKQKNVDIIKPLLSQDQTNSVLMPTHSSNYNLSTMDYTLKPSRWRRFINFICCYQKDQLFLAAESNITSTNNITNPNSMRFSVQDNLNRFESPNEALFYQSYLRNSSNLNSVLYNILQFNVNGFTSMSFGKYSFFQIPIRFQQHQCANKKFFSDILGRIFPGDLILVVQTYLDWEFIARISKVYSHIVCSFSSYLQGIPQQNYTVGDLGNINGNSNHIQNSGVQLSPTSTKQHSLQTSGYSAPLYTKMPETFHHKQELQNAEFLHSSNLSETLNFEIFDRVLIIPTSFKQQGNSFDVNFNMRQEFHQKLKELIFNHIEVLHKTVFLLPKYCKIQEVVNIIYESFYESNFSLYDLNLGIQFHSITDEYNEVDSIILIFEQQQHIDTLTAISQKIFSNINPSTQRLSHPQKKFNEIQNKENIKSKKLDDSSNKKLDSSKMLDLSQRSSKSAAQKSEYDFVTKDDMNSSKDIDLSGQKTIKEFITSEYVLQIGQAQFENIYQFLFELNTQNINQDNLFYYRTYVIDSMLKNNVIQQSFVQKIIQHFVQEDLNRSVCVSPIISSQSKLGSLLGIKKSKKKDDKKMHSNNNIFQQTTGFKEFFLKNSKYFTQALDENNDKSTSSKERIYSPSDYDAKSETTTDQDLNFQSSYSQNNILQQNQNIQQLSPQFPFNLNEQISNQNDNFLLQNDLSTNPSTHLQLTTDSSNYDYMGRTQMRQKQISCNFPPPANIKNVVFKLNKKNNSALDEDILNSTTASRLSDNMKINMDLKQKSEDKLNKSSNEFRAAQDISPREVANFKGYKINLERTYSQE